MIIFFIDISNSLFILLVIFLFSWWKKILYDDSSTKRYRNILRHELELKWIKLLQTPHSFGLIDDIYCEGNISRLPEVVGFFSLLDNHKRNKRSHGKRKNRNLKCRNRYSLTSFDLSMIFKQSGCYIELTRLVTLSISSLRNLDIEANRSYDISH